MISATVAPSSPYRFAGLGAAADFTAGARMTAEQKIYCGDTLLVAGKVEACVMTLAGKPRRIPDDVRRKLLPYLLETGV